MSYRASPDAHANMAFKNNDPCRRTLRGLPPSETDSYTDANTSFACTPPPSSLNAWPDATQHDFLHLSKYVPVGCLRHKRDQCRPFHDGWKPSDLWAELSHSDAKVGGVGGGRCLSNEFQEWLLESSVLKPYRGLLRAGYIRMEFKANDFHAGQTRVYVLPDDVGQRVVNKQIVALRRPMQQLLSQLDISKSTWSGYWDDSITVSHISSSCDARNHGEVSLFEIFNSLPSPNPDPEFVANKYAKSAMYDILDNNIRGLTTTLYKYQRRSAAMMLQREAQVSQLRDPRLEELTDQNGNSFYCDPNTGTCLLEPRYYDSDKGGILAENMGLGKTLISLALILATKGMAAQAPVEYSVGTIPVRRTTGSLLDMAAAAVNRHGAPWSYWLNLTTENIEFTNCAAAIKRNKGFYVLPAQARRRSSRIVVPSDRKVWLSDTTIVVVPANLVKQWVQEINKHTKGLNVLVMSKSVDKVPPARQLIEFDIILFSRQRFDKEAQDGSDPKGRRTSTPKECHCEYIGSSRIRNCTCLKDRDIYHSPLRDVHFKRLITDEGHIFGNASKSSITDASTVVQFLQVTSRWIVSGTPTQGLYGTELSKPSSENPSASSSPLRHSESSDSIGESFQNMTTQQPLNMVPLDTKDIYKQERKDLEKLGNIATLYLKIRPWANTVEDNDPAQWSHYVMQPRHGSKSHGNMHCLKSTLESMIIRHRPIDVENDVVLPPLHQTTVVLDGSLQDKLSLNLFSMMIICNAITSERKDADYLFHPRQRAALDLLVKNLRQASFHWSGFSLEDVKSTTDIAKDFLEKGNVPVSPQDKALLEEAIQVGDAVLSNDIKQASSFWHEMPMYVRNDWPEDVRASWSLNGDSKNPTLMGATMLHSCQKFVERQLWKEDPMEGLEAAGKSSLREAYFQISPTEHLRKSTGRNKDLYSVKRSDQSIPVLAGGIVAATVNEPSPMKKNRLASAAKQNIVPPASLNQTMSRHLITEPDERLAEAHDDVKPKSALKKSNTDGIKLDPNSPLGSTMLISTSSAKLTYLMEGIIANQCTEKILIFYESENVAYYIAQALECLHIKHLIYAKSLPSDRKSRYVVTFNQTETFRVLLMDITQAAFGLDMSSASRVYFVNPVISPHVEAQAVKRAHRIGQTKPVFVETLVLKGGIEEVILERRQDMSPEELQKCKSTILNDQKIYSWIRNVRFIPLPVDNGPGPSQMAPLDKPEHIFGRGRVNNSATVHDPDADLVMDSRESRESTSSNKRKTNVAFDGYVNIPTPDKTLLVKKKKTVAFEGSQSPSVDQRSNDNAFEISRPATSPIEMRLQETQNGRLNVNEGNGES